MKIPDDELWFSFSRSGGPGGQNVNKVASKVTLCWDLKQSKHLTPQNKARLLESALIRSHLDSEGVLSLVCQSSRSQNQNRQAAIEKLEDLVRRALVPKTPRRKTRMPRAAKERRLTSKRKRSERLSNRRQREE